MVEASVVMPTFLLLCFGLVTLGFLANNYINLASATAAGANQLALDTPALFVGSPVTLSSTPYTDLQTTMKNNAGLLSTLNKTPASSGGITITSVCVYPSTTTCASGGTTCNSDATCSALLASDVTTGGIATVSTSYPCFIAIPIFFLKTCTLTASASAQLQ